MVRFACTLLAAFSLLTSVAIAEILHPDWLVEGVHTPVQFDRDGNTLRLSNGIIERTFLLEPNLGCYSFRQMQTGEEFLRGIKPEGQVVINGATHEIGGVTGQPNYAFFMHDWLDTMEATPDAFVFTGYSEHAVEAPFEWKRVRHAVDMPWPPAGRGITFSFSPPEDSSVPDGVEIHVHYELYVGIPVLSKWISIENGSDQEIIINSLTTEMLAMMETKSEVNLARTTRPRMFPNQIDPNDLAQMFPARMQVLSDYSMCGMSPYSADQTTFWEPDPDYATQVNYDRSWPHLYTSRYPYGPGARLASGETFTSYRNHQLLHDSDDRERKGLGVRKMLRTLAPWITENPTMLHLRYSDSETIRAAVDQCVEVGFEMIILSFGSGFNMESTDPEYIARIKDDFAYAHERGIEIGGYSLLSSRRISDEHDVINPETGKPGAYFNHAPCLASEWGLEYFEKLKNFMTETGCNLLEHDGSYPGDVCASHDHPGHEGLADSQWAQHKIIDEFYKWCRSEGIYLNVPDYYLFNGSNKIAMGYRETNWSLPRAQQIIHTRQNIYDGTFLKPPSMGWMFVPLVEYHGGGAAATIEPLREHLDTYEMFLVQNLLSGVQACYRGPRLYDAPETKAVVKKWVDFYKEYRAILESDIIHLRRADGRDWDGILHANPDLERCGFTVLFNPRTEPITRDIRLPLYYTGVKNTAFIREQDGEYESYDLDRDYNAHVTVTIPAGGFTWLVIENGDA